MITAKRVTDFRIDTVEIAHADYVGLSQETKKLIDAYGTWLQRGAIMKFELPIHRWDDIPELKKRGLK